VLGLVIYSYVEILPTIEVKEEKERKGVTPEKPKTSQIISHDMVPVERSTFTTV